VIGYCHIHPVEVGTSFTNLPPVYMRMEGCVGMQCKRLRRCSVAHPLCIIHSMSR
jgi:hypothetical protein